MHVHCPRMLMWCSLLLLVVITVINVCAVHANLLCRCLQHARFSTGVTKYMHMMHLWALSLN